MWFGSLKLLKIIYLRRIWSEQCLSVVINLVVFRWVLIGIGRWYLQIFVVNNHRSLISE